MWSKIPNWANAGCTTAKLADIISDVSDDLIDCQFARVRAAYAKCKGAHAALPMAADENCRPYDRAPLDPADKNRMTQDLLALMAGAPPVHDKPGS